jgi:hypothetical protein
MLGNTDARAAFHRANGKNVGTDSGPWSGPFGSFAGTGGPGEALGGTGGRAGPLGGTAGTDPDADADPGPRPCVKGGGIGGRRVVGR